MTVSWDTDSLTAEQARELAEEQAVAEEQGPP